MEKIVIKSKNFTKVINCFIFQNIPIMEINVNNGCGEVDFLILEEDTKKVNRIISICK